MLSDIHAYSKADLDKDESKPSFVEISNPANPSVNPFTAVHDLIKRESLKADVLISGGDMGDKASPQALSYAWTEIQRLATALGAQVLLPATGNHDMDSRFQNGYDARGTLQGLENYPFAEPALRDKYWANNVVVQTHGTFRSVLLNSAAFHGAEDSEWKHGRVSSRTRQYLKEVLAQTPDPGINILVTHHHLYPLGGVNLDDYSEMREGSALLQMLESGEFGSWLVVHGHRHWPSLSQAGGSQGAPIVFSAGSFSALLYAELQDKARNQFYVLEVEETAPGHRVRGRFTSWDWISDEGFLPSRDRSGLPHKGGFGGSLTGAELAEKVRHFCDTNGQPFTPYDDVVTAVPELDYAMPKDLERFVAILRETHGLSVLYDDQLPTQIGRTTR